jgi:hypothetical protein
MIYFTVDAPAVRALPGIGLMVTPARGRQHPFANYACWAADNGCFTQGERFSLPGYLAWLKTLRPYQRSCRFAVAPDVVADARATLARSLPVLPQIRALGYPAAFVAQDGLEDLDVPWQAFDVLFIGGSTRWKLSEAAATVVAEAKQHGLWTHMGRVNSLKRLRAAQSMGCDSCDGTMVARKPDARVAQLTRWLAQVERQPMLAMWEGRGVSARGIAGL